MDNVYTLNEIGHDRLKENKKTYAYFLDIRKAYDSVWCDGLWYKLWDMGVCGEYIFTAVSSKVIHRFF